MASGAAHETDLGTGRDFRRMEGVEVSLSAVEATRPVEVDACFLPFRFTLFATSLVSLEDLAKERRLGCADSLETKGLSESASPSES